jgi:hypothetical protein
VSGWKTVRAHSLVRGDIVTLDEVTESVVSVNTNEKGRLVVWREGVAPVTLHPDDMVEVYR